MRRHILSLALLAAALAACACSKKCPPEEELPSCSCYDNTWHGEVRHTVRCKGNQVPHRRMEDFRSMLLKHFAEKTELSLHFTYSSGPMNLSSANFDGLPVKNLRFLEWDLLNWSDEFGGKAFVGLEDSLKRLEVVRSISAGKRAPFTLSHLRGLEFLSFNRNQISVFGNEWLGGDETPAGLVNLTGVFLVENGIAELGDRAFAAVPNVRYLNVERNEIEKVSRSMFPNPAENLYEFNLRDNKIQDLPENMFENMPDLRRVNVAGNPLQYVRESTWKSIWPQLSVVTFESTNLHCDDHINWMTKIKRGPKVYGTCKTPAEVAGQKLSDVIRNRRQ